MSDGAGSSGATAGSGRSSGATAAGARSAGGALSDDQRGRGRRNEDALFWSVALAFALVTVLLRVAYVTLNDVANGQLDTLPVRVVEESTGVLTAALLFVLAVAPVIRRFSFRENWRRALAAHAVAFPIVTVAHTLLMAFTRPPLFELFNLGEYHYGPLGVRMLMEAPNDLIFYSLFVAALEWYRGMRARAVRERRALELERELAASELANLRLQLQPHFLFNALNTIASTTWEDPSAADAMIGHLSELLRHALGTEGRDELPLAEELELLDHYLALARARFGERLTVRMDVQDSVRKAMVPTLLLQPLVENAIRHGVAPDGSGDVVVSAARDGGVLRLVVENRLASVAGSGVDSVAGSGAGSVAGSGIGSRAGGGVGLSTTVRRLTLLHGSRATVEAGENGNGRWCVRIELPFREALSDRVEQG